jgi:hypothetical protein
MTDPVDPETGATLHRDVRPLTLTYKGATITVDMPGWYGDRPDQGVFDAEDMKVSDRALNRLKARIEGLVEPEEIRRIRKKPGEQPCVTRSFCNRKKMAATSPAYPRCPDASAKEITACRIRPRLSASYL